MAKEELIEMRGLVNEVLPDSRFRVTLENGHQIVCYSGGKMRKHRNLRNRRRQQLRSICSATQSFGETSFVGNRRFTRRREICIG